MDYSRLRCLKVHLYFFTISLASTCASVYILYGLKTFFGSVYSGHIIRKNIVVWFTKVSNVKTKYFTRKKKNVLFKIKNECNIFKSSFITNYF